MGCKGFLLLSPVSSSSPPDRWFLLDFFVGRAYFQGPCEPVSAGLRSAVADVSREGGQLPLSRCVLAEL